MSHMASLLDTVGGPSPPPPYSSNDQHAPPSTRPPPPPPPPPLPLHDAWPPIAPCGAEAAELSAAPDANHPRTSYLAHMLPPTDAAAASASRGTRGRALAERKNALAERRKGGSKAPSAPGRSAWFAVRGLQCL